MGKHYVLANALSRKFPNREALETRLIALFKNKACWLNEIASPEAEKAELKHKADLMGFSYNFENHLGLLKDECGDLMIALKTESQLSVPPIARFYLNKVINIETYCALDYLLDFSRHINDLVWKSEKLKIEKYKSFFNPSLSTISKIARPYFMNK